MSFDDFIKAEFPLTKDIIYYESARITPPSKSVHDAIRAFYDDLFKNGEDRDKYDMKARKSGKVCQTYQWQFWRDSHNKKHDGELSISLQTGWRSMGDICHHIHGAQE